MRSALYGSDRPVAPASAVELSWSAIFNDGSEHHVGDAPPAFTLHVSTPKVLQWLLDTDVYSAGEAFVRGKFEVEGDLEAAIRFKGWQPSSNLQKHVIGAVAHWTASAANYLQTTARAARNIHFHYDRSNDFYRLFLDPEMVYSCAYFRVPDLPLAEAQIAKLDHICRKLDLQPGDHFLDIGCGWGALVKRAVDHFGAVATGCTLSQAQYDYAAISLGNRASIVECDYHRLEGQYDKIASVGMFEHVGPRHASEYFRKLATLLAPGGLLLNHAIARFRGVSDDGATHFVRRYIFPGGRLSGLDLTIQAAEDNGFEVLDVENLRPHYALTCRLWRQRLEANHDAALRSVDEMTYRAWRIWLAGSALSFEQGLSSVYQILLTRRGSPRKRMTREYMYS